MDEGGVAAGHGDVDPGADGRPPARWQHDLLGGAQVGPGVAGMGVGGQRQAGIEPADRSI